MVWIPAVVVLEVMWGWRKSKEGLPAMAPSFYFINPQNFSGRRLHSWISPFKFLVTNACPQYVTRPNERGRPDPLRLAHNLQRLDFGLLIVCGSVAQRTLAQCSYKPTQPVLKYPHPAARNWTLESLDQTRKEIQEILSAKVIEK